MFRGGNTSVVHVTVCHVTADSLRTFQKLSCKRDSNNNN